MKIVIMADEERYNNRQIERLFDEQSKEIKAHIDLVAQPILTQTLKTNGRVNKAEDAILGLAKWQSGVSTGFKIGSWIIIPLCLLLVGYLGWLSAQVLETNDKTRTAVDEAVTRALDEYIESVNIE